MALGATLEGTGAGRMRLRVYPQTTPLKLHGMGLRERMVEDSEGDAGLELPWFDQAVGDQARVQGSISSCARGLFLHKGIKRCDRLLRRGCIIIPRLSADFSLSLSLSASH